MVKKTENENHYMNDIYLSLKAKGLLTILLNWENKERPTIELLARYCGDGKSSIQATVNEIKALGYLKIHPFMEEGRISHWEWDWSPEPIYKHAETSRDLKNKLEEHNKYTETVIKKLEEINKRGNAKIRELKEESKKLEKEIKLLENKNNK